MSSSSLTHHCVLVLEQVDAAVVERPAGSARRQPRVGGRGHRRDARVDRATGRDAPPNSSCTRTSSPAGSLSTWETHAAVEEEDRHLPAGAHRLDERLGDPRTADRR